MLPRTYALLLVLGLSGPSRADQFRVLTPRAPGVDDALALLRGLDRARRQVLVEVLGSGRDDQLEVRRSLGARLGDELPPAETRARSTRTRGARQSQQTLRLVEGGSATLFVGDEQVIPGGLFGPPQTLQAGGGVEVRLLRVDPGRGALLEVGARRDEVLPAGGGLARVARRQVGTTTYAPFGQVVTVGTWSEQDSSVVDEADLGGRVTVFEQGDPRRGRRRIRRRPLQARGVVGRTRLRTRQAGGFRVRVREVPTR